MVNPLEAKRLEDARNFLDGVFENANSRTTPVVAMRSANANDAVTIRSDGTPHRRLAY